VLPDNAFVNANEHLLEGFLRVILQVLLAHQDARHDRRAVVRDVVATGPVAVQDTVEAELAAALDHEEVVLVGRLRLQALLAAVPDPGERGAVRLRRLVSELFHVGEVILALQGELARVLREELHDLRYRFRLMAGALGALFLLGHLRFRVHVHGETTTFELILLELVGALSTNATHLAPRAAPVPRLAQPSSAQPAAAAQPSPRA
jgi:hypothetical protein